MKIDRRLLLIATAVLAVLFIVAMMLRGTEGDQPLPQYNVLDSNGGAAIKGYDPVAYFQDGGPRKGKVELAVEHGGARWLFSSERNKDLFVANPEKYLPAYGGYCAYGVAQGALVKIEPDAWAIRDDTLYLNYDKDIQKKWDKDWKSYVDTAGKKWPSLIGKQG